ncbi:MULTISPECIES: helix-turn-helix domain-containing protein [unclassified Janthinobacterium]|uniref:helix-turn-helix domain-containing protein n=1 Tax=unclassified Janthinobacterium TaxID=2610881 RepID=UPI0003449560|nr:MULTISPECIES: helix-turn-helix domain-containing protein [unclassified Janthinobacterium]MEC5161261.1 AraC family ethanolamine operon transcriptional activator [Janthinobacterium sp. CG_S6]
MHQNVTGMSQNGAVPNNFAAFRTVLTRDADELARHLTDWEQSYDQISSGSFHGVLDELRLPRMQVFRESISQSVRQSCRVWPGAVWFGFPDQPDSSRINGRQVEPEFVMVQPGDKEFELLTPSSHVIYGIVVCSKLLVQAAVASGCMVDWQRLHTAEVLRVDPAERRQCVQTLAALLAQQQDAIAAGYSARQLLHCQNMVVEALVGMLDHSGVEPAAAGSFQRRQRIVARVREYILAHRDQTITVPELCEQAHVSRRTLQYCFEDVLGMSPTLYLRRVRLNGVRRQLMGTGAPQLAIGAVAADWGFSNFSQFSSDYRKLFGESASASLRTQALRLQN